jgi:hypothetical protein
VAEPEAGYVTIQRTWQRRHVNGVLAVVTSVPGIGTWKAWISKSHQAKTERLHQHFSLLTEALAAADRQAGVIAAHDWSLCEQWNRVEAQATQP